MPVQGREVHGGSTSLEVPSGSRVEDQDICSPGERKWDWGRSGQMEGGVGEGRKEQAKGGSSGQKEEGAGDSARRGPHLCCM